MDRNEPLTADNSTTYEFSVHQNGKATLARCTVSVLGVPLADASEKIGPGLLDAWASDEINVFSIGAISDEVRDRLRPAAMDAARLKMIELQHVFNLIVGV